MILSEALAWLDRRVDHESSAAIAAGQVDGLGLGPMQDLMALLGDPQDASPVIHITGTNGKGTVATMISALLVAQGLTVGTYTSPHESALNERIRRNLEPIGDEDLADVLSGVALVEELLESTPTWFEAVTAAAFRWFAEAPVDVAVIEVGLLGRYDATNVANARVAVVTSVGGDHTDFAPGWELAVAGEKAGILTPECTAVLGPMSDEIAAVFAAEGPAELLRYGQAYGIDADRIALGGHLADLRGPHGTHDEVLVPLYGAHQVVNASIAVAAVESFFDAALPDDVVREAFASLRVPGRLEVLGRSPLVIVDGAHNPDALRALARTIDEEFSPVGSRIVVLGQLAGRDPSAALEALAPLRFDLVVCTTIDGPRGQQAEALAAACERAGLAHETVADPVAAVGRALAVAAEDDMVVVTGSLRLVAPARRAVS